MNGTPWSLAFALILSSISASYGASVFGTWYGHADLSEIKRPRRMAAGEFDSTLAMMRRVRIELVLNQDRSFTLTTWEIFPKPEILHGTWKRSRNALSLNDAGDPRHLRIASDGKTIIWSWKDGLGAKVIFDRSRPKTR
jgi:hypothetical protein